MTIEQGKFEEARRLQHEFWDSLSALEEVLGVEIDGTARQTVGHIGPNELGCDVMQPTGALRVEIRQQEQRAQAHRASVVYLK